MDKKVDVNINTSGLALTLIFIALLVLKVCEVGVVANWSWWWITAPLWAPITLVIGVGGITLLIIAIIELIKFIFKL